MAVYLQRTNSDRFEFTGNPNVLAGQSAMSVALRINISALGDYRLCGEWGSSTPQWLLELEPSDLLQLACADSGYSYNGFKTSSALSTGWNAIVCTFSAGTPPTATCYVNGSAMTFNLSFGTGFGVFMSSSSHPFFIGYETAESVQGVDGDYAEFGLWNRALSADEAQAISSFAAPTIAPRGLLVYLPLRNKTENRNRIGDQLSGSFTGGTDAVHPKIVYPHRPLWLKSPSQAVADDYFHVYHHGKPNVLLRR